MKCYAKWYIDLPNVWIRRFILSSEGWGIVYPQNSTAGLYNNKRNESKVNLLAIKKKRENESGDYLTFS